MARFLKVTGGTPVGTEVEISGSKNAALALMAAAIVCDSPVRLKGVPWIQDIFMMMGVLRTAGARCGATETT